MENDAIRARFEVQSMQQTLLHHFAGYEAVIKAAIENAVTPENLMKQVIEQVNNTLAWKIGMELQTMVANAVRESKQLHGLIDGAVEQYVEGAAKKKKRTKKL